MPSSVLLYAAKMLMQLSDYTQHRKMIRGETNLELKK